MRRIVGSAVLVALGVIPVATAVDADPGISPTSVEAVIYPGESLDVAKTVGTPALPPKLDICLLEDETGSYFDDIAVLQAEAGDIYDVVVAAAPDSQFAVAGFRDYPVSPFGSPGDWVYRRLSAMSALKADWLTGVGALTAGGGNDTPEAQYDAIVAATGPGAFADPTLGSQPDCGWRADPDVTRVLLVATDAPFHTPSSSHVNDSVSTIAALTAQGVRVIGIEAPGAGAELDALAAATGGSVQALGSTTGEGIGLAILAGLSNLPIDVGITSDCAPPIGTSFAPTSATVTSGDDAAFTETISVAAGAAGGTYTCTDTVTYDGVADPTVVESKTIHVPGIALTPITAVNELTSGASHTVTATVAAGSYGPLAGVRVEFVVTSGPNTGATGSGTTDASGEVDFTWSPASISPASLGTDSVTATFTNAGDTVDYGSATATKDWVDTTPPTADCTPTVNPAGKKIPSAPGNGAQAKNQDGFYQLDGDDEVWPDESLAAWVFDSGSGTWFGPFSIGTTIKYTEDPTAVPVQKPMGGPGSAVAWHLIGNGDGVLFVVDGSWNYSTDDCLVPPAPK